MSKDQGAQGAKKEEHVSKAFSWFHATSVNGGAMVIAAVISSYFSQYMTDHMGLAAGAASLIMFMLSMTRSWEYLQTGRIPNLEDTNLI